MGSRVCDIKKKFEGLCEASKGKNITESTSPVKLNHVFHSGYPKKTVENSNSSSSVGTRGIIKRSHAFRSEKVNRTISGSDNTGFLYESKPQSTENKQCLLKKENTINSNKVPPQNHVKTKTLSIENKLNVNTKVIDTKQDTVQTLDQRRNNSLSSEYAIVSKRRDCNTKRGSVVIQRPDSLQITATSKINQHSTGNAGKTMSKNTSSNYNNNHNKLKQNINTKPLNLYPRQFETQLKSDVKGNIEDCDTLSSTLKKVLRSPLPSGPPPKKPPRTFAHITDCTENISTPLFSESQKIVGVSTDDINLESERVSGDKQLIKPIRSKTESQIMLKKLEIALLNHQQQGKILQPTTNKKLNLAINNSENESMTGNPSGSSHEMIAIRKCSLPDTPSSADKYSSSSGCFGVLSCSNSMDLMKSSHIYDIPFEPKSQFYIEDESKPLLNSFISKENSSPELKPFRIVNTKQNNAKEPVYAKPQIKPKSLKIKEKSEVLNVSQVVKNINSIEKSTNRTLDFSGNVSQKPTVPDLHYMSSPIVEKVPLFPNPPPEKRRVALESCISRTFPGRSASVDVDCPQQPHSGAGRSFSVDLSRAGDKDFHIDHEKIQMMVNEVYSKCLAMPQDSDSESVASTPDDGTARPLHTSPEEAKKERQQRTAERKTYLKRVCSRTKSFHRPSVGFPRLFEYLLLIGLDLNPARCKVPYIKDKYPEDAEVPRGIEQLCFPDASDWPPQACSDESGTSTYCIVITNASGIRKFGYCRRVQPEGAPICLPLAYCIVTPYKANHYFGQVLAELESRHGQPEQALSNFIQQLYECPFPMPGQCLTIVNSSTNEKMEILHRRPDLRQEECDIARLLNLVRFSVFLQLFVTLLLERKVILLSYSISKLSSCIEGLCAALYPFHWQHTLVPIVPCTMLDLCQAPTPYVIGLLKPRDADSQFPINYTNIDQVLVVDVDESRVVQCCGDESTVLPSKLCRGLREALHCAVPDKNTSLSPAHNLVASEALIALFVQLVGHYRDHIITSSSTGQREFQRDSFVRSVASSTVQSFLDWFSETTMFTAFIESRLDRSLDPWGLFEQRCVEHLAQQHAPLSIGYRANINKTVKSFGDRFKEWTNSNSS
uniref:UDENN domain-containing protein n=1 Tax=Graphocephala atropunctata TaxID=36148 RepID=A0A1B6L405_9HEMI